MKTENLEEIGKRMGQQKGKTYNYYKKNKGNPKGSFLKKLIFSLTRKRK